MSSDIFEVQNELISAVKELFKRDAIFPRFQHEQILIEFEKEVSFATGEAIGAFARHYQENCDPKIIDTERKKVNKIIELVLEKISPHELERRCLDISSILSSIFEKEKIWSVLYKGTLIYDGKSNFPTRYFYYIDDIFEPPPNSQARGHSWIFTPSYPVIDLTAKFQPLPENLKNQVPHPVLLEHDGPFSCPNFHYFHPSDQPPIFNKKKEILDSYRKFPDWNRLHKPAYYDSQIKMIYIPMEIIFPDERLENFCTQITIGGQTAIQFYDQIKEEIKDV